jgi:superoxide dismutase, Cu-Zn family
MHAIRILLALAVGIAVLAGCTGGPKARAATVTLEAKSGSSISGTMKFSEHRGVVRLRGTIRGLEIYSEHGFHVHEKGDCSAADASSAGGHFNPGGTAHGAANAAVHHAGDLPSLRADAHGVASIDTVVSGVTLGDGPTSIKGRSLVVHGKADDYTTQPSGNSGPRIACGVI